jgi:hypothetical protein
LICIASLADTKTHHIFSQRGADTFVLFQEAAAGKVNQQKSKDTRRNPDNFHGKDRAELVAKLWPDADRCRIDAKFPLALVLNLWRDSELQLHRTQHINITANQPESGLGSD